jgi:hypothetical protein
MAWSGTHSQEVLHLIKVSELFADFTIFMDNFLEGRFVLGEPVELTDFRNSSQHQLMSVPSARTLQTAGQLDIDLLYEACRLACIAYSLLVVFPLPPTVGLFEKLAQRIRTEIANLSSVQDDFTTNQREMHFWILVMGSVVSTGIPDRRFFVTNLLDSAARLGISDWQEAVEVLETFLWHPSTNNKDGLDLWRDMQGNLVSAG